MSGPIYIRDFSAADIADVLAINAEASPGVSRLTTESVDALLSLASLSWVAVCAGKVAGYLIGFLSSSSYDGEEFLWFKHHRRDFIYVDQLAVASSSRGVGIGRRLYSELARWCPVHACFSIVCEVNLVPPNPASLIFHKSLGFSEVDSLVVADGRKVALLECFGIQFDAESLI
jgi:uncharacterized protein